MFKFASKSLGFLGYVIKYGCWTHCTFEYLGDFVICSGPSMEPTIYTNNILITDRISPRLQRIYRGDIIIATNPTNPMQNICKRVIGLPGDKIVTYRTYAKINPFSSGPKSSECIRNAATPLPPTTTTTTTNASTISNDLAQSTIEISSQEHLTKSSPIVVPLSMDELNDDDFDEKSMKPSWSEKIFKKVVIVPRGHVWIEGDNVDNSADSRYYGPIPQGLIKSRAVLRLWPFTEIKLL